MKGTISEKYFVYILECSDHTFYTGTTNDLEKRLQVHNQGKGAKYTRGRLPVALKYSEICDTKGIALSREHEIKSLTKDTKKNLIINYSSKLI